MLYNVVVLRSCLVSLSVYCFCTCFSLFFFFKQKTAYEMRISDWSSDVCSSDLAEVACDHNNSDLSERVVQRRYQLGFLSTIHAILHSCAQATVARRLCAVKSQGGRNRPCGHVRVECRLTFDPEGFLADPAKLRSKTFPVLAGDRKSVGRGK